MAERLHTSAGSGHQITESAEESQYQIPAPSIPEDDSIAGRRSFSLAAQEFQTYADGSLNRHIRFQDWKLNRWLKLLLFVFVLALNAWWDIQIKEWIWASGNAKSGFHLGDNVLIALVTTSVANFLALIIIVAKHLFPSCDHKEAGGPHLTHPK